MDCQLKLVANDVMGCEYLRIKTAPTATIYSTQTINRYNTRFCRFHIVM